MTEAQSDAEGCAGCLGLLFLTVIGLTALKLAIMFLVWVWRM